ncbi:MAG: hypothetical protein ACHQ16_07385 [Candidatus Lutacidiplasmatales archaeon]|jgi:hypothetical protein
MNFAPGDGWLLAAAASALLVGVPLSLDGLRRSRRRRRVTEPSVDAPGWGDEL